MPWNNFVRTTGFYQFVILWRDMFSKCALIWGLISKTKNIFENILGPTYWLQSMRKNYTNNFCLLVYLRSYNNKSEVFTISTAKPRHVLFANEPFLRKILLSFFSSNIHLYIEKKNARKSCLRFWKWNLKHTPQSAKNSCF